MKLIAKVIFTFISLIALKVNSQNQIIFGLQKDYTKRHININHDKPFVYPVINTVISSKKRTKVKKKSPEYSTLEKEIFDFENYQEEISKQYDYDYSKYINIKTAINNINIFLSSQKPVEASREILSKSQKILNNYNIKSLVYADKKINNSYETKYSILSSNYTNLKVHLRNIIFELESINTIPKEPLNSETIEQLKQKLEETPQYVFSKGPTKTIKKTKKILGDKVLNIPAELTGDFIIENNYTILTKDFNSEFKKGILIKYDLAKKKKLITKGFAKKTPKKMIINIKTKKTYLVDFNFLKKYAYTFNGKYRYQAKNLLGSL